MLIKDLLPGDLVLWVSLRARRWTVRTRQPQLEGVEERDLRLVIDITPSIIDHGQYGRTRPGHTLTLKSSNNTDSPCSTWWSDSDEIVDSPINQVFRDGTLIYEVKANASQAT